MLLSEAWQFWHIVDGAFTTSLQHHVPKEDDRYLIYVFISVFLVALAGLMSGSLALHDLPNMRVNARLRWHKNDYIVMSWDQVRTST